MYAVASIFLFTMSPSAITGGVGEPVADDLVQAGLKQSSGTPW